MFGPVVTTEAHLAFSGAKTQSKNTAETLSFLGPHGPVARDEQSCIDCNSQDARRIRSRSVPLDHSVTNFLSKILLCLFPSSL